MTTVRTDLKLNVLFPLFIFKSIKIWQCSPEVRKQICWCSFIWATVYTPWVKKTLFLTINFPDVDRFSTFFHQLIRDWVMESSVKVTVTPHLKRVTALPCQTYMSENRENLKHILFNNKCWLNVLQTTSWLICVTENIQNILSLECRHGYVTFQLIHRSDRQTLPLIVHILHFLW